MPRQSCIPVAAGVLLVFLCAAGAGARTWYVKPDGTGDAPTVRGAMDSARAGDEVLLAPGIYRRSREGDDGAVSNASMIRMKAGVTLRGEAGPERTAIWGENAARVICCTNTGVVRIEGLTIAGGLGPGGAGIQSDANSYPIISQCIVQNNSSVTTSGGAGISCYDATISNCQILGNLAGGSGAGIACYSATISNCSIRGNTSVGRLELGASGAGIYAAHDVTITDCRIEYNHGTGFFDEGGGVFLWEGGTIARCTFVGNTAQPPIYGSAGGGGVTCAMGSPLRVIRIGCPVF